MAVSEHAPPERGLGEVQREAWQASLLIIDPTEHSDGQKVALEFDNRVGIPTSILNRLVAHINARNLNKFYFIEVEAIFNKNDFWEFAEIHKGKIKTLAFEFVAPNMFGTGTSIDEAIRDFQRKEKAAKVGVRLKSNTAIDTTTPRVKESVDYASRGTGFVRARTKEGIVFDSRTQTTSVDIEVPSSEEGAARDPLLYRAPEILGRR